MSQLSPSNYFELFPLPKKENDSDFVAHCPRCENIFICNIETGEVLRGRCNTYSCSYCGYRKARRLQNALYEYFKKFKFIRFWTFTISSTVISELDLDSKIQFSSEVWRRFLTSLRRSKKLSKYQQKVQYVKVLELQKNDSPHYHCFFDRYIDREILNNLWETTIISLLENDYKNENKKVQNGFFDKTLQSKNTKKVGNAYVEGIINKKAASDYVTKYLMKSVETLRKKVKFRIWSKSERVKLFKEKEFYTGWRIIILPQKLSCSSFTCLALRLTSQESWSDFLAKSLKVEQELQYISNTS